MILKGTRQAIYDAMYWGWLKKGSMGMVEWSRYMCRIDRSVKQNNDDLIQDELEAGYILAAIDSCRPVVAAWLYFCHHNDAREADRQQVALTACYDCFGPINVKKLARHRKLCEVAVDDYRLRVWRTKHMPAEVYAEAMGIDSSNFARDWHDKRGMALDYIKGLDAEGMGHVSRMVRALRGEGDRPHAVLAEMRGQADCYAERL